MDKTYADTVRLLLAVAPDVFANDIFAMKGGTAINLFVRDMPRLSVDIDVVYLPWQTPRDEALQAINQELAAIATRVAPLGVQTRLVRAKDLGDTKLIVENDASQVKIEVNVVFRGSVLPVERRPLSAKTSDLFGVEFELPVLAPDELYASKLVAALDRQHPREHLAGRAGVVDDEDAGVAVVQRPLDRADDIGKGEFVVLQDVVDDLPLHDPAARGEVEGGGEDD